MTMICRTCGRPTTEHTGFECPDVSASDSNELLCDKCDECGGSKTYENQVVMPLNGKNVCIDWCIHQIVSALNAAGIQTVACCCGHGKQDGRIDLEDGRILIIKSSCGEYNAEIS